MGVYVFSRRVLLDILEREAGHDFGRELIPGAIGKYRVRSYLYRGYWADVGTIESFYQNNVMLGRLDSPFHFWDKDRPIYTHLRHLPGSLIPNVSARDSLISEGCYLAGCSIETSVVGVRMAVREGSRITRSVLLGADFYEYGAPPEGLCGLGIGKDVVLDRVIIDKNARIGDGARLVNEQHVEQADGDGYYVRSGIIVVAKGGVIKPGTVV
jgi:glucose-1-phosphate adenylyltransferase